MFPSPLGMCVGVGMCQAGPLSCIERTLPWRCANATVLVVPIRRTGTHPAIAGPPAEPKVRYVRPHSPLSHASKHAGPQVASPFGPAGATKPVIRPRRAPGPVLRGGRRTDRADMLSRYARGARVYTDGTWCKAQSVMCIIAHTHTGTRGR